MIEFLMEEVGFVMERYGQNSQTLDECKINTWRKTTFPERDMSRLPTAVIRLGTTRGRIKAFSIRRNSSPEGKKV